MNVRFGVLLIGAVAWPAAAQSADQRSSSAGRPAADPNQKVCEDITVVGSRLATKRICATRAEWASKKQQDKDEVDRIQRNLCVPNKSGNCHPGG
jgi:hypothetical protein